MEKRWLSLGEWKRLEAEDTNAHRIYSNGTSEWIERYENDLLICQVSNQTLDRLLEELAVWSARVGFEPRRIFHQYLLKSGKSPSVQIRGEQNISSQVEIREHAVRYTIDFKAGGSTGLFLDQRANRAHISKLKPKQMLNCFAYTCSFSVVAAMQGAVTTNVDLSRNCLQWGKKNFQLNEIELERHFFNVADVRQSLHFFAKKKILFDAIVIDPPTFSRSKQGTFRVERDFFDLLGLALQCAYPVSNLLLSVNLRGFTLERLIKEAKRRLEQYNLRGVFWQAKPLIDIPTCSMPTTTWLTLDN